MDDPSYESGVVHLSDARQLHYVALGPKDASVVVYFHGMFSSAVSILQLDRHKNARLIAFDRPAYGFSSPLSSNFSYETSIRDVEYALNELGVGRFSVVGWSSGGPYCLACAAILRDRVQRVDLISSDGPYSSPAFPQGLLQLHDRVFAFLLRTRVGRSLLSFVFLCLCSQVHWCFPLYRYSSFALMTEDEQDQFASKWNGWYEKQALHAMSRSYGGSFTDLLLERRDWGFRLEDIQCPVGIWHGDLDRAVSVEIAHFLHSVLPNSVLHILPNVGHFAVLWEYWQEIIESALTSS
eukprot:GILK01011734.1.p1 GENE.GILK01011734.1~~GILK01011734.1.p1  ORF type:complete len:305 (+),score=13.44 GILK01011734.1:32-916(+)